MPGIQHMHFEIVPRSVAGIEARSFRDFHHLSFSRDHQSRPKILVAPPQADHVVIGGPLQKRIVSGVVDHQTAAPAYIFLESLLYAPRPANPGVQCARH